MIFQLHCATRRPSARSLSFARFPPPPSFFAHRRSTPSVLITGACFASVPELAPNGATVITADEIWRAGVSDVNHAICKVGGVYGRQSLNARCDFALDLRGFGSSARHDF